MEIKDRLIVALDVPTAGEALNFVTQLRGIVGMFKIGSQLFTAAGPRLIEEIVNSGARVFLDLKFHDIPHQVTGAVHTASGLGVSMLTIHASGGSEMMKRAAEAAKEVVERRHTKAPLVVAVTVLTSMDSNTLGEVGLVGESVDAVKRLALLAAESGVDGVVASPQEIGDIRAIIPDKEFLIVTPGIRPEGSAGNAMKADDQRRVASPGFALAAGANYLVVGRPILAADMVPEAARRIVKEMEMAVSK